MSSSQSSSSNQLLSPTGQRSVASSSTEDLNQRQPRQHLGNKSGNSSDGASMSSFSSKPGFKTRLKKIFKAGSKVKKTGEAPAASVFGPAQDASTAVPTIIIPMARSSLDSLNSSGSTGISIAGKSPGNAASRETSIPIVTLNAASSTNVPTTQIQLTPPVSEPLRDIFPQNIPTPLPSSELPQRGSRITDTLHLAYLCGVFERKTRSLSPPTSAADNLHIRPLDLKEQEWVNLIESAEQEQYFWLVQQLVEKFSEDTIKHPDALPEIVIVGPVLERTTYRALLGCLIARLTLPLDIPLLRGLVQLIECSSTGYLVDDDLVAIATFISKQLSTIHIGTSSHPLYLVWALSRVLDVMVSGKVKDLNRDRDHQPMLKLLEELRDSDHPYLKHQAAYAYQALLYVPDDETLWHQLWRYTEGVALVASAATSIIKMDPVNLVKGLASFQEVGGSASEVIKTVIEGAKTGIEGIKALREDTKKTAKSTEKSSTSLEKHNWFLALQGTALYIRQGRLRDFKQIVVEASCRHNINFQWGICRQIGEIASHPLWDVDTRLQAVDFLGELGQSDAVWKLHSEIKEWITVILDQIMELSDGTIQRHAHSVLGKLKIKPGSEFRPPVPLCTRLALPATFPLLAQVQKIPKVEFEVHKLKTARAAEYKQLVYVPPSAKRNLQAPDDKLFSLMDEVQEFLKSRREVMLILGDSGAGKSTFNRYLENWLWKNYKADNEIPLFINLPALERPERDLIVEQLRTSNFSDEQIREMKQHRRFVLICDGYDEAQLTTNLHTTNLLNRAAQWSAKMIITCRTQYLVANYHDKFRPQGDTPSRLPSDDLFQEAIIAPFSEDQIESYIERYVSLASRSWIKKDYMDMLKVIPNLQELARNPFLLTICLEALPGVVQSNHDLPQLKITRVLLYDHFTRYWLGSNKRRIQGQKLSETDSKVFDELLDDHFEQSCFDFQRKLAMGVFKHQGGGPVIEYVPKLHKTTWKSEFFDDRTATKLLRQASLLIRAGNKYLYSHRSILEYFFSCNVCPPLASHEGNVSLSALRIICIRTSIADHPLSLLSLAGEKSIVQFLSERVQQQDKFKAHLHALIEQSKTDPLTTQAAANAMTILVQAGIQFHGADLRGIRVSGADLTGGWFDSAQFQDSDLTGVNLSRSCIQRANFSNAQMEGVQFGVSRSAVMGLVESCIFSSDESKVAISLKNGHIYIYDTMTQEKIHDIDKKVRGISNTKISFSPPFGQQFVIGARSTIHYSCGVGVQGIRIAV